MKQITWFVLLIVALCCVANDTKAQTRTYISPSSPDSDGLPFSGAVKTGDTLYLSGDIGLTADMTVPEDPKEEARLLMDNVRNTLAKAGYTMDDLVTVTVYCSDIKHYADFNEVYRGYFKENFPARAFVGAGTLLFNARFELQGIAVKRANSASAQ